MADTPGRRAATASSACASERACHTAYPELAEQYATVVETLQETPLPLPGDAAGVSDFDLDGIQCNSFGTVRVFPKQSVIDGTVYWQGGTFPESPPLPNEDLKIPLAEGGVVSR